MNKSIKQIADELGVPKQQVYRYIKKNRINEVVGSASMKQYDESAQTLIKQGFQEKEVYQESHHEAHQNHINDTVIDTLVQQLEIKDKQIEELQSMLRELNEKLNSSYRLIAEQSQSISDMAARAQYITAADKTALIVDAKEKKRHKKKKDKKKQKN